MPSQTVRRIIDSPVATVFDTVAHVENFAKAVPHIVRTDVVSDVKTGVGARFRETRLMNGREVTQELEVTEYEPNQRVRIICDAGGTLWDSLFTTSSAGSGTELELTMEARPHKLLAKLTVPLMMLMIRKAVESDIDAVKTYCKRKDCSHTGLSLHAASVDRPRRSRGDREVVGLDRSSDWHRIR